MGGSDFLCLVNVSRLAAMIFECDSILFLRDDSNRVNLPILQFQPKSSVP